MKSLKPRNSWFIEASSCLAIDSENFAHPSISGPIIKSVIIAPAMGIAPSALEISIYTRKVTTAVPHRPIMPHGHSG